MKVARRVTCEIITVSWLRVLVVERWSLIGELSLSALDLQPTGDHLCG